MVIYLIIGIIAIFGIIIYLNYTLEKKRTEGLQRVATQLGMNFSAGDIGLIPNLTSTGEFSLLSQGHSQKIKNVMSGIRQDIDTTIFDYSYVTGHGKNRHTHQQTVLALKLNKSFLPKFSLKPENIFHKVGTMFGYQDIDFENHPAFSSKYLLRGVDETAIRSLFTDSVIAFYESETGFCTEVEINQILFYRPGVRVKPENIRPFLDKGLKLLAILPPIATSV